MASKERRDEEEVRRLRKEGVVRDGPGGILEVDAGKLTSLPVSRISAIDTRRQVGNADSVSNASLVFQPEAQFEAPSKKIIFPPDLRKQELLSARFSKKEFNMSEEEIPRGVGLDVGTAFLVTGRFEEDGKIHFSKMRDCFLELVPKSPVNRKFIQKGLEDRQAPYIEKDGKFYVLGEEAFLMSNERHINARRPMHRGVLAPQEEQAFPILKELISRLVGKPRVKNERLVFSVPGKPIDADFDQQFHQEMLRSFINSLGYQAVPMNEAEALAYSELIEEGLTGICISAGGGMMNVVVMSSGDPVVVFSTSKSGDWVDQQAAVATNNTAGIVQQEKESPDLNLSSPDPSNQIHQALSVYYGNLLVYTLEQIAYDLSRSPSLPKFKEPIPLVVGGGTSLPTGFISKFEQALKAVQMPVVIKNVRHASDPLFAVANGLTLAATMD